MRIRPACAVGVTLIAVLAVTGCRGTSPSGSGSAGPGTTETVKIMVGGIDKVIYLPAKLTEQLGYFKEQGINVELLTEPAGVNAETAMLAGEVQGVVGFYDHTVDLQSKGKCATSVVQFADVPGEVEMVANSQADKIKTAADFKGKKLGVTSPGSSTDFLTQALAAKGGLAAADYTTVKAGAGGTFVSAITNGGIDAGMTTDPTAAQLLTTGQAKVLLDMRTEQGTRAALGGLYPAASLYADCAWVDAHKPAVQKLANALIKGLKYINSHTAAEIAQKMPADYYASGLELYVKALNDSKAMFNEDGKMKSEGAKNVLAVLSLANATVKAKKDTIDLSKTYTMELADNAK